MADPISPRAAVRFCPFCGQPIGSFFGARLADGAVGCDRCGEYFRVENVELDEGCDSPEEPTGAQ